VKVVMVYGNPKQDGFVHGCLDHIGRRLEAEGVEVARVRLIDCNIGHCAGCFTCLRTGQCAIEDDMNWITPLLREADGWVVGASVRNGYVPALYKTFYERITYLLAFTWVMFEKHILAVGAVGYATGKKAIRDVVGMKQSRSNLASMLFFRTGIPTKVRPEEVACDLDRASDRFLDRMRRGARPSMGVRLARALDQAVIYRYMMKPSPETYSHVLGEWKRKGYL